MVDTSKGIFALLIPALFLAAAPDTATAQAPERTFLMLANPPSGSVEAVAADVRSAIAGAGWELLAEYNAGVNRSRCDYRARVMIADWPEYARAMTRDSKHGAFAAQVRINVFEDENGVHVAAVNPRSLNRTIVSEKGRHDEWNTLARQLEDAVHTRIAGKTTQFGQLREHGRIGKTMGVMAGGPFTGKVRTIVTVPIADQSLATFAANLYAGLKAQEGSGEWKVGPVFRQAIGADVVVIGLTSPSIEARSFDIVHKGADNARAKFRCPGIDHASAYPVELLLVKTGQNVSVQMIDEMFRMKMYFEDAGMMAFAKNMRMPGSIEAEINQKVRNLLPTR